MQVVSYIIDSVRGRAAFDIADYDNPQQNIDVHLTDLQRLLLVVCAVRLVVTRRCLTEEGLHFTRTPGQILVQTPSWCSATMHALFGQVANLVALLLAWVYIFDTIQKEREMLEQPEQDVYGSRQEGQHLPHPQVRPKRESGASSCSRQWSAVETARACGRIASLGRGGRVCLRG